ncbi:MAG: hypothetical protein HKN21_12915 [Candidatus Eisenbacteria bacterium]|uniref:Uncharacterized protein n=1 Tax=Eiseniibacteriota bacterium TaxID=2212470 RepID=A0A7Y2H332_UNCEI|nr:hypothetical protein [Candidatus Eisenbacteria bacterium]
MSYRGTLSLNKIQSEEFRIKEPIEVVVEKSEDEKEVWVRWDGAGLYSSGPDIHRALEKFQMDLETKAKKSFAATAEEIRESCMPRLQTLLAHVDLAS